MQIRNQIILFVVIFIGSLFLARSLNFYGVFVPLSTNMAPSIYPEELVMTTNLISYQKGDIISYEWEDETFSEDPFLVLMRLKGLEGDTIEIIDGLCFVNGELTDDPNSIQKAYWVKGVSKMLLDKYIDEYDIQEYHGYDNKLMAYLVDSSYNRLKNVLRLEKVDHFNNRNIEPIVVPVGFMYVLGDSRDRSADSRVIGYIPIDKYVAKVVSHN